LSAREAPAPESAGDPIARFQELFDRCGKIRVVIHYKNVLFHQFILQK